MIDQLIEILKDLLVAPHWYPIVPLLGFIVIAAASVGSSTSSFSDPDRTSGAAAWPAPAALSLLALCVITAIGHFSGGLFELVTYTVLAVACAVLSENRGLVRAWVAERGPVAATIRDAVVIVIAVIATTLTLELSWNTAFPAVAPQFFIEVGLIAGILLSLYFLGQRSAAIMWVAPLLAGIAGTCQYFLAGFKGVAILPSDLLAMPTAFKVKEGYSFVLGVRGLWGPAACCVALAALSLLGRIPEAPEYVAPKSGRHSAHLVGADEAQERPKGTMRKVLRFLINTGIGLAIGLVTVVAMTQPNYIHDAGVKLDYGKTLDSYRTYGFLTGFVAAAQDLPIATPLGYTAYNAANLQVSLDERYEAELGNTEQRAKAVEQFEAEKPSVIVVMNESFADLSVIDSLRCGYEGPAYFKSIGNAITRGDLAVSVIGGGTCNTEFEFLTGNSYAFVGSGKYPYIMYRMRLENLADQLSSLGYATHAIHPNDPTNWNRDVVYDLMGFDEFVDISAFEGAEQLHMGVTDAATYDKILEILKLDPSPQFVFDVTMQNHGSYNLGNIPEDKQVHLEPEGVVDDELARQGQGIAQEDVDQLNEYLACIQASDADLKAFMDELSKLDRKVVLVFFGDHQPAFSPVFNDFYYADEEDEVAHKERVYHSNYFIWANYDVAGVEQKSAVSNASADMLGAMTLQYIGAPLTTYQQARLVARQDIQALNAFGYLGADGVWYASDDDASPYAELRQQLAYLNYLNFGSKVYAW
ncbi:MAG: LTA synthase family protein [Atopobiaceae bacterium]|nr:LTA synthase family protein [Atopobiaceae bacterium]